MNVYFFRHGIAVDKSDPGYPNDRDRPLTKDGIKKTREAAAGLKCLGIPFDSALTSGWVRASQTAEILVKALKLKNLETLPELEGDRSPGELIDALSNRSEAHLLLVGHEPLLSSTMARLLSSREDLSLDLKKSGVGAVELATISPPTSARLLWLLTAKQLRCMAKS
jgi:phosphohistidine phosphatase